MREEELLGNVTRVVMFRSREQAFFFVIAVANLTAASKPSDERHKDSPVVAP